MTSRNVREGRYVGQVGPKAVRYRAKVKALPFPVRALAALAVLKTRLGGLRYFMLAGRQIGPCGLMTWSHLFEQLDKRRVRHTQGDGWAVSTIFLGMDHSFGHGPEQLFETAVLRTTGTDIAGRCATWDEAVALHANTVALCRGKDAQR